ncbi:MAG: Uncharacterised protein [Porticoccaceae bacterium UBA1117]|nr:MAG: Uncharacterised protein [Porticoccaceae bacterium UBA1117]
MRSIKVNFILSFRRVARVSGATASVLVLLQQLGSGSGVLLAQQASTGSEVAAADSSLSAPTSTPAVIAVEMAAIGRIMAINGPSIA